MSEHERYPVPVVGSMIDLAEPVEVLQAYHDVEQAQAMLAEAKRRLTGVLVEHSMVVVAKRTVTLADGSRYERVGGPSVEYTDPAGLARKLREAGMAPERVAEIVVETIDRKVNGTQANAAARSNPDYERIIGEHRVTTDRPFRIQPK